MQKYLIDILDSKTEKYLYTKTVYSNTNYEACKTVLDMIKEDVQGKYMVRNHIN